MTYHLLVVLLKCVLYATSSYRWRFQSKFRLYDDDGDVMLGKASDILEVFFISW